MFDLRNMIVYCFCTGCLSILVHWIVAKDICKSKHKINGTHICVCIKTVDWFMNSYLELSIHIFEDTPHWWFKLKHMVSSLLITTCICFFLINISSVYASMRVHLNLMSYAVFQASKQCNFTMYLTAKILSLKLITACTFVYPIHLSQLIFISLRRKQLIMWMHGLCFT